MHIEEFPLPTLPGNLLGFSLTPSSSWVAYVGTDYPPPNTPGHRSLDEDWVVTANGRFEVAFPCHFPKIAAIDDDTIAIANSLGQSKENVWLIDGFGNVKTAFDGGDAKHQLLSTAKGLVVTYFDEGVFSRNQLSPSGVNFFSRDGTHVRGYNRVGGEVLIADCYCACIDDSGRLLFSSYMDFPLVRLNLETWEQEVWRLPEGLHSSQALAATSSTAFFWGNKWRNPSSIFAFDLESGRVSDLGSMVADRRLSIVTLTGGRFVAPWQDHYTIIDPRS
jgi:hypothetical protein